MRPTHRLQWALGLEHVEDSPSRKDRLQHDGRPEEDAAEPLTAMGTGGTKGLPREQELSRARRGLTPASLPGGCRSKEPAARPRKTGILHRQGRRQSLALQMPRFWDANGLPGKSPEDGALRRRRQTEHH